jgi:hypothetical protein
MKLTHSPARLLALLSLLPTLAQAHPGHSALDWFSALPHTGHDHEYAVILTTLGLIASGFGAYWLASRRR